MERLNRSSTEDGNRDLNAFHVLTDDLLIPILVFLSSAASSPTDVINVMLTCKRFHGLLMHPRVLANVGMRALAVKAASWSDGAQRFLQRCAKAGNLEACYILGMIQFYCLGNTEEGAAQLEKAASRSHAEALYSLAVIHFNESGKASNHQKLERAVTLCQSAVSLGNINGLRELACCLVTGYGVQQNYDEGYSLMSEAAASEEAHPLPLSYRFFHGFARIDICTNAFLRFFVDPRIRQQYAEPPTVYFDESEQEIILANNLVPAPKIHIANRFLVDWFNLHPQPCGFRICSYLNCGRPETRPLEFSERCARCNGYFCSWACSVLDWCVRHKCFLKPSS